jgi:hypothetical protein
MDSLNLNLSQKFNLSHALIMSSNQSNTYHDYPSHASSCRSFQEFYAKPCPCEDYTDYKDDSDTDLQPLYLKMKF